MLQCKEFLTIALNILYINKL